MGQEPLILFSHTHTYTHPTIYLYSLIRKLRHGCIYDEGVHKTTDLELNLTNLHSELLKLFTHLVDAVWGKLTSEFIILFNQTGFSIEF